MNHDPRRHWFDAVAPPWSNLLGRVAPSLAAALAYVACMTRQSPLRTPLCDLLQLEFPIVQAPIGRVGGPALAAAVANAGGLGMLGLSYAEEPDIRTALRDTNALTDRPFGVNLILEWDQRRRVRACLDAGVRIVS